jgi:hypothetical protein
MEAVKQTSKVETVWKPIMWSIEGVTPLMLHNNQTVDPFNPYSKKMKPIKDKRTNKSDHELEILKRLEWESGLYIDENGDLYIPDENLFSCIWEAGKLLRDGKQFRKGFETFDAKLVYPGPKDLDKLYEDGRFVDYRTVKIKGSSIMRCRPIFETWGLQITARYNQMILKKSQIERAIMASGDQIGLGDYRPRYGRFEVTAIDWMD